ncbi:hypothetical protein J6590_106580, partial [Homalodisca vitripennis]
MAPTTKVAQICTVCDKPVTDRQNSVGCYAFCKKWYHTACVGLSAKDFANLRSIHKKISWYCEPCRIEVKKMIENKSDQPVANSEEDGKASLSIVLDELTTISENLLKLNARVSKIENVSNRPRTLSSALSPNCSSSDVIDVMDEHEIMDQTGGYVKPIEDETVMESSSKSNMSSENVNKWKTVQTRRNQRNITRTV